MTIMSSRRYWRSSTNSGATPRRGAETGHIREYPGSPVLIRVEIDEADDLIGLATSWNADRVDEVDLEIPVDTVPFVREIRDGVRR